MKSKENNYAFIDSQNLNLSIRELGWRLDFRRFRRYLAEKYKVTRAYIFIGYVDKNQSLYKSLQESGYVLIFKPTLIDAGGKVKGNCDAELVLHSMIEYNNYDRAVIVTGDGDFYCLAEYLIKQGKLKKVLVPNQFSYSALLKAVNTNNTKYLAFMNDLRSMLKYEKKKAPEAQNPSGAFSS